MSAAFVEVNSLQDVMGENDDKKKRGLMFCACFFSDKTSKNRISENKKGSARARNYTWALKTLRSIYWLGASGFF